MKHFKSLPIVLLFYFLNAALFAQGPTTKRLESLPSFFVTDLQRGIGGLAASPDGKRIWMMDYTGSDEMLVIDPLKKRSTYIQATPYRGDYSMRRIDNVISPNLRYRVRNTFAYETYTRPQSGAAGLIATTHDWQTLGSGLVDWDSTKYDFEFIEQNFTLAVTNDGKLITTKPGGFKRVSGYKGKYGPPVPTKYEGLFLVDPIANSSATISTEKFTPKEIRMQSPDSKIFCWIEVVPGGGNVNHIIHAFDVATAKSWTFTKPFGETNDYRISNTMLLSRDWVYPIESNMHIITLYDLRSGKLIAKEKMPNDYAGRLLLTDDKLFFFSSVNYSVVELKPNDKQGLQVMPPLMLDTAGLQVDPKRGFVLMLAGDQLWLMPGAYIENQHTRAWAFNINTGQPTQVIYNLYKNLYPPSEQAKAAKATADCELANRQKPFTVGAVIVEKEGNCNNPTAFIIDYDCKTNKYEYGIFQKAGVYTSVTYAFELGVKYKYCSSSNIRVCDRCHGRGSYNETVSAKLDQWEQVNFNVYVRDPNKVTRTQVTTTCPVCNGRGIL